MFPLWWTEVTNILLLSRHSPGLLLTIVLSDLTDFPLGGLRFAKPLRGKMKVNMKTVGWMYTYSHGHSHHREIWCSCCFQPSQTRSFQAWTWSCWPAEKTFLERGENECIYFYQKFVLRTMEIYLVFLLNICYVELDQCRGYTVGSLSEFWNLQYKMLYP